MTFRPAMPWWYDLVFVWLYAPVLVFSGLALAIMLDLGALLGVLLVLFLLSGWPVMLLVRAVRYEVGDGELTIRWPLLGHRSVRWDEVTRLRRRGWFGADMLRLDLKSVAPVRLSVPPEQVEFLAILRARLSSIPIEGV